jgi:sterol desaturase/sphingolipid hydroxylase (fatty acid hydroxylase superfamily)
MFNIDFSNFEIWFLVTIFLILRYILVAGMFFFVFYIWKKKKWQFFKLHPKSPSKVQIKREILYSMLTFFIYSTGIWVFLYWIKHEMTMQYMYIDTYGIFYFVFSICIMFVLHDTYFYWTHRLMHHPKIFKVVHRVHHTFENPTPWTSFAFHPFEAIISIGIIPIIIFIIPYHQVALIIFATGLTLNNIIIHLGYALPDIMSSNRFRNTAVEHDLHHNGISRNYGLYFNFWDKLMGTFQRG